MHLSIFQLCSEKQTHNFPCFIYDAPLAGVRKKEKYNTSVESKNKNWEQNLHKKARRKKADFYTPKKKKKSVHRFTVPRKTIF